MSTATPLRSAAVTVAGPTKCADGKSTFAVTIVAAEPDHHTPFAQPTGPVEKRYS